MKSNIENTEIIFWYFYFNLNWIKYSMKYIIKKQLNYIITKLRCNSILRLKKYAIKNPIHEHKIIQISILK